VLEIVFRILTAAFNSSAATRLFGFCFLNSSVKIPPFPFPPFPDSPSPLSSTPLSLTSASLPLSWLLLLCLSFSLPVVPFLPFLSLSSIFSSVGVLGLEWACCQFCSGSAKLGFLVFFNNSVKLENEQISIISVLKTLRTSPVAVANV